MDPKIVFIIALTLFVGFALGNEDKPNEQLEPLLTTDEEQFEMENHDLREVVERYRTMVEEGLVTDGIDVKKLETALNRIMTHRVLAKENGETKNKLKNDPSKKCDSVNVFYVKPN